MTELARYRTFEEVVALLWDAPRAIDCTAAPSDRRLVAAALAPLSADTGRRGAEVAPLDRIPVAIAVLAATDPHRFDRRPDAVRRVGARNLAGAVEAVRTPTGGPSAAGSARVAERLGDALQTDPADPARARRRRSSGDRRGRAVALDAALVLLADHELAASTLAARVAASTWADPYRVVLTGLGPLAGPLHGAAALAAQALLAEVTAPELAPAVLERHLAAGVVPGFGHRVYRDRDPRADVLLGRVAAVARRQERARCIAAVLDAAAALDLPAANVDLALAAVCDALELDSGAPAIVFTVARIAGIIAHALEEYPHRLRFRSRATYVGPTAMR